MFKMSLQEINALKNLKQNYLIKDAKARDKRRSSKHDHDPFYSYVCI